MGSVFGPIRFILPVCRRCWFLYTLNIHFVYMPILSHIFLSNYWWQKSEIWSQTSYRYPISWEAFFDPSDSYFLVAEERGYHKWALDHSSSCCNWTVADVCQTNSYWAKGLFEKSIPNWILSFHLQFFNLKNISTLWYHRIFSVPLLVDLF